MDETIMNAYGIDVPETMEQTQSGMYKVIQDWLSPDTRLLIDGTLCEPDWAIPSMDDTVLHDTMREDLLKWQAVNAFDYIDPFVLLRSYIHGGYKDVYLSNVTKVPVETINKFFINRVEKVFFLTHGYGRPNPYIGSDDISMRTFIIESSPTAITLLSNLVGVEGLHNVLNALSSIRLTTIPANTINMMMLINTFHESTQFMGESIEKTFKEFGILPLYEYDSETNTFTTNLMEVDLYTKVLPERLFSMEEIENKTSDEVSNYIVTIPDDQLLTLLGHTNVTKWSRRTMRKRLVSDSVVYLCTAQYKAEGASVIRFRIIDRGTQKTQSRKEFFDRIQSLKAFHDGDTFFSSEDATSINGDLTADEKACIEDIRQRTNVMIQQNRALIESIPARRRDHLVTDLINGDLELVDQFMLYTHDGHPIPLTYQAIKESGFPEGFDTKTSILMTIKSL